MKKIIFNNKINILFLFISFICLVCLVGLENIFFTKIQWLYDSDESTFNQLGWHFFKNDIWRFPFGSNPNFGGEIGNSIVYTDSIPVLALFFKLFKSFLPENFQYFSLWYLLCFYFQLFFSFLILKKFTNSLSYSFIGSLFFLLSPIFIFRADYHVGLSGQWVLLFGLYLGLTQRLDKSKSLWILATILSSLIHFYFTAILLTMYSILRISDFYLYKENFLNFIKDFFLIISSALLTLYLSGYFEIRIADSLGIGFGVYKLNILSFLDPGVASINDSAIYGEGNYMNWSLFLPDINLSAGEEVEGFNYFGLGQIIIILLALILYLNKNYKTNLIEIKENKRIKIIFLMSIFFTLWALSNKISFGSLTLIEIPIHKFIFGLMSIIKSTGRIFWIVNYFLLIISLIIIFKCFKEKTALLIIISFFVIQMIDISPGLKSRIGVHTFKMKNLSADKLKERKAAMGLNNQLWDTLLNKNKVIMTTYPISWSGLFGSFSYAMEKYNIKKTNLITVARIDRDAAAKARYKLYNNFRKKILEPKVLYAIDGIGHLRHLKYLFKDKNVGFFYRDNVWSMVLNEKELMNDEDKIEFKKIKPTLLKINNKEDLLFKHADSYYGLGWSHNQGKKGIWSEGEISTLFFRTENNYKKLKLEVLCKPHITKKNEFVEVDIYINNIFNKKLKLSLNQDQVVGILISKKETFEGNDIKVDFHFKNPISPFEVLASPDSRKLGILLKEIELKKL